jgi:hypothetical protein
MLSCGVKEKESKSQDSTRVLQTEVKGECELEEEHSMSVGTKVDSFLEGDSLYITEDTKDENDPQLRMSIRKAKENASLSHTIECSLESPLVQDSETEYNDTVSDPNISSDSLFTEIAHIREITETLGFEHNLDTTTKVIPNSKKMTYDERRGIINREAVKNVFIPKGQWMFGGQITWRQLNSSNLNYLIVKDTNLEGTTFSVCPYLAYFFADNIAVGARFSYNRNVMNLGNLDLNLGDDFNIGFNNLYYHQQNYETSAFLRSYLPIGNSKIFGLFGELQLNYMLSKGSNTSGSGESLTSVCERLHNMEINFAGGISMFFTDYIAAELMLNVGGYRVKWGEQNKNNTETGSLINSGANFRVNLFSLKFGITYYL